MQACIQYHHPILEIWQKLTAQEKNRTPAVTKPLAAGYAPLHPVKPNQEKQLLYLYKAMDLSG